MSQVTDSTWLRISSDPQELQTARNDVEAFLKLSPSEIAGGREVEGGQLFQRVRRIENEKSQNAASGVVRRRIPEVDSVMALLKSDRGRGVWELCKQLHNTDRRFSVSEFRECVVEACLPEPDQRVCDLLVKLSRDAEPVIDGIDYF